MICIHMLASFFFSFTSNRRYVYHPSSCSGRRKKVKIQLKIKFFLKYIFFTIKVFSNASHYDCMANSNGLYGPFALSAKYVQDMDVPCCYVRITTHGKKLPEAVELSDVYEPSLVFLLDESYHAELVEISLQNIVPKMSKQNDSVHVEYFRENDYSLSKKGSAIVQFRNSEHSVTTMSICGNETIRIYCQLPGQIMHLVIVVKFIFHRHNDQMIVVD